MSILGSNSSSNVGLGARSWFAKDPMTAMIDDVSIFNLFLYATALAFFGPVNAALRLWSGRDSRFVFGLALFAVLVIFVPLSLLPTDVGFWALLLCATTAAMTGVAPTREFDHICRNAALTAMAPIPLVLTLVLAELGAMSAVIALELVSLCFALFAISSFAVYDATALNAFFWASALVSFSLICGFSLLTVDNGSVLSSWGLVAKPSTEPAASVAYAMMLLGLLVKVGVQPFAWWIRPFYKGLTLPCLLVYFSTFYLLNLGLVLVLFTKTLSLGVAWAVLNSWLMPATAVWLWFVARGHYSNYDFTDVLVLSTATSTLMILLGASTI